MNITLYAFTKRRNSTKRPNPALPAEQGVTVDVKLKENTSIYTPHFILQRTYANMKYLKWDSYYYFITDVVYLTNDTIEISCEMDYMGTCKFLIGESTQFVTRSASSHNAMIIDELTVPFGSRLFDTVTTSAIYSATNGYYCVGFSFSSGLSYACHVGVVQYVFMSADQLSDLCAEMMNGSFATNFINPIQYVVSCVYVPFERTFSAVLTDTVKIGLESFTIKHYAMPNTPLEYIFHEAIDVPQNQLAYSGGTNRAYMHYAPFLDLTFYCGPFGTVKIPTEIFPVTSERKLSYSIYIDYTTGKGKLYIYRGATANVERIINILDGQLGVPVQLSQITSGLNVSNAASMGTTLITAGAGLVTKNPELIFTGAAGVVSSATNMLSQSVSSKGSNGSVIDVVGGVMVLVGTYFDAFTYDPRDFGAPLCQTVRIDTLSGYVKTADAELTNASSYDFSVNILDQVKSIMDSGFFYE